MVVHFISLDVRPLQQMGSLLNRDPEKEIDKDNKCDDADAPVWAQLEWRNTL